MVLDSEGLWSVVRNEDEQTRAVLASSSEAGVPVLVPAIVLAESLYGDQRDARANQVLEKLQVVDVDEPIARRAAGLKRLAGVTGVEATIDAVVVAVSAGAGGGLVLTSDPHDIRSLAAGVPARILALPV